MSAPIRILFGLTLGLIAGVALNRVNNMSAQAAVAAAEIVGNLWINALQMTVIPLVFALLVSGVASTAKTAAAGGVSGRAIAVFAMVYATTACLGALWAGSLLAAWPVGASVADALKATAGGAAAVPAPPPLSEWLRDIIPSNPIASAAQGAILPIMVFALFFGFALGRRPAKQRDRAIASFNGFSETLLTIIGWVLWAAPVGVFALALVLGAQSGFDALGLLAQYIVLASGAALLVMLAAYPIAVLIGGVPFSRFVRAGATPQAVAFSTQSSLASLPSMLRGADDLQISRRIAGVVLPLAVSLLRATAPAYRVAVVIYAASIYGLELGPAQILAAAGVAIATSVGGVSLPGPTGFFAAYAPVFMVVGLPLELLALFIVVEFVIDGFATMGNVTCDLAATAVVARSAPAELKEGS